MLRKKLNMPMIIWQNIVRKPVRSWGFLVLLTLFAFFVLFSSLLESGLINGLKSTENRLGADVLIVPKGSSSDVEGFLLKGTPSSYYLDSDIIDDIKEVPGVKSISTQVDVGSLNAGCCSSAIQLIGFDADTDFVVGPWISSNYDITQLKDDEIIIGNSISGNPGDTLLFFNKPYKVVARLDRTGMGYDVAAFMNIATARSMATEKAKITGESDTQDYSKVVSSILIDVEKEYTPFLVFDTLEERLSEKDVSIIKSENIIENVSNNVDGMLKIVEVFLLVIWVISLALIMIMFTISLNERSREIAIFRSSGASKAMIIKMVVGEVLLLSAIAVVLALGIGSGLFYLFNRFISEQVGFPFLNPTLSQWFIVVSLTVVSTMIIGPLAAINGIYRINRNEIYSVIQED